MIHFWTPEPLDGGFAGWDPDLEPGRYPSGVGHCLLELYKRLRRRGVPVTVGPVVPGTTQCLVAAMESFYQWHLLQPNELLIQQFLSTFQSIPRIVAIRGDIPETARLVAPRVIEVVPHTAAVQEPHQIWIPLLPQRGLIRRSAERRGAVRTVGIFAYTENVPDIYHSPAWRSDLAGLGMAVVERTYDPEAGVLPVWHDFSDVDVLLGARHDVWSLGLARKPPVKLINAWSAGCIPLLGANELGSVELGRPGIDCLVAEAPEATIDVLAQLADPEVVRRLEAGGAERAGEFSVDRIVDQWLDLLEGKVIELPGDHATAPSTCDHRAPIRPILST